MSGRNGCFSKVYIYPRNNGVEGTGTRRARISPEKCNDDVPCENGARGYAVNGDKVIRHGMPKW